jgi:uncharacterized caspase-like protein
VNIKHLLLCMFSAGLLPLLVICSNAADTRGLKRVVVKDREGREIGLYKGSYALLIGVSDYSAGWPDLRSIPDELVTVETMLKKRGFMVRKILNPTAEAMKAAFEEFIGDYGYDENNRLLFFFSGHGFSRKNGTKGYLVPADAPLPEGNDRAFLRKALSMGQILTWAREMEAKHALFLFDSCFSGTIFKSRALPTYPPHISSVTARPVRQFITAGDAGETVPAKSVFTPMFVRGLDGAADMSGDGYVTGTELGLYLRDQVLGYRVGQTPQFDKIRDPDLDEGDFVFVLRSASGALPGHKRDVVREESNARLARELARERRELELERASVLAEAGKLKRERSKIDEARKLTEKARKIEKELAARSKAGATVSDIRVEFDKHQGGKKGLLIHSQVTLSNHRDQKARIVAYFNKRDGSPLKDFNDAYHTSDGKVSVGQGVVPIYDSSTWKDHTLFIPYGELHMMTGRHPLKLNIQVWDTSMSPSVRLAVSDGHAFTYTETGHTASIENIRTEYDVCQEGRKGMLVHAHVSIKGLKGAKAEVSLYFNKADGSTLKDRDGRYKTGAGQVSTHVKLTPNYDDTNWKDLQLFMPYKQLHLAIGKHDLKFDLYVWDHSSGKSVKLAQSDWQNFTVTDNGKWATLDDVRVEHNIYQGQKKGMRLHSRLNIAGLKGQSAEVAAYFYFKGGAALKDFDDAYNTSGGKVEVHERVTPGHTTAEWKDFKIFMPYDQLHLAKGKSDCKFYMAVWDQSGSSAAKLTESGWTNFDYSK